MKSNKGQALVETALVLPILLILLFGIVDFGRVFHAYLTLDHAGREAARVASVQNEDSVIITKVTDSTVGLDVNRLNIDISPGGKVNRPSGTDVTVTLTYNIDFITPLVNTFASPLTLTDATVMRVE